MDTFYVTLNTNFSPQKHKFHILASSRRRAIANALWPANSLVYMHLTILYYIEVSSKCGVFPQISGPTTSWNLVELLDAHINLLYINVWQELFGQVVCIVVLILSSCEWLIWGKISYYIVSWVRLSLGIHCCMINSCKVGLLERNIHIYISWDTICNFAKTIDASKGSRK